MSFGRAVRDHFLAPAAVTGDAGRRVGDIPHAARVASGPRAAARSVGLLCSPGDAAVLGGALARTLARRCGAPVALVCTWRGGDGARGLPAPPATRGARRLARTLADRGHDARAAGRLVLVAVPGDDAQAAAVAGRALAAAGVPSVLAVAGPRGARLDELLCAQDLVVVADAEERLASMAGFAAERLAAFGVPVARCPRPSRGVQRLAAAGASVAPGLAAALDALPATPGTRHAGERGQATFLVLGLLLAIVLGAVVLGAAARGVGAAGERQRAADLAALAGASAMHGAFGRLFEPPTEGGRPNPRHLERAAYEALARRAAERTARRNGAREVDVAFPDGDTFAPVRIRVTVRDPVRAGDEDVPAALFAEAELAPPTSAAVPAAVGAGEYRGPLEQRQGRLMRPDVARAFDRMASAARADGVALLITSAWRSNAEQAALYARRPDPKWVAPPGRSLHRLGTELDVGPAAAYAWLAANAKRFGFVRRYAWEPWHYGYTLNAGTSSVGFGGGDGARSRGLQSFVPAQFASAISRAAQRWSVSGALLAAQLYAESGFNPFATSRAGAQGIAQFMPGTARAYGLANPLDPDAAIDAQARLMRDLLRQFGSVPLALAAYNAGPAPVQRCGCIPPYAETRGYVARILGLLGGAGDLPAGGGLSVRLVR